MEFEVQILFWFILFWIPIMVLTNYRFNSIIIFFETMQIMYALFAFLPSIEVSLQSYFKSYQYLSFGGRDFIYTFERIIFGKYIDLNKEDYNKLIYSFPDVPIVLIIFILMIVMQIKWRLLTMPNIRVKQFIMVWLFLSFQFLVLSAINNLILFYKFKDIFDILSILFSLFILLSIILFFSLMSN